MVAPSLSMPPRTADANREYRSGTASERCYRLILVLYACVFAWCLAEAVLSLAIACVPGCILSTLACLILVATLASQMIMIRADPTLSLPESKGATEPPNPANLAHLVTVARGHEEAGPERITPARMAHYRTFFLDN